MDRTPVPGTFYRHFKNKLYQIVAIAVHSETGEQMVVYQALYGDYKIYVRPLEMFLSPVDREKYPDADQEYRFEQVEPGAPEASPKGASAGPKRAAEGAAGGAGPKQEPEAAALNASLLSRFLDAEEMEEQLAVLKSMEGHVGQKEIDCICLALDIPSDSKKELGEQLRAIGQYIMLQQHYDGNRLR